MVCDVLDLRSNNWVPRHEEVQAKTITNIHTEAEKNLGLQPGSTASNILVPIQTRNPSESCYCEPDNHDCCGHSHQFHANREERSWEALREDKEFTNQSDFCQDQPSSHFARMQICSNEGRDTNEKRYCKELGEILNDTIVTYEMSSTLTLIPPIATDECKQEHDFVGSGAYDIVTECEGENEDEGREEIEVCH